jgi:hypothetical protein
VKSGCTYQFVRHPRVPNPMPALIRPAMMIRPTTARTGCVFRLYQAIPSYHVENHSGKCLNPTKPCQENLNRSGERRTAYALKIYVLAYDERLLVQGDQASTSCKRNFLTSHTCQSLLHHTGCPIHNHINPTERKSTDPRRSPSPEYTTDGNGIHTVNRVDHENRLL